MVDMENDAGIDYTTEMTDTWHPTQAGYNKMAELWFDSIDGFNDAPVVTDIPDENITGADVQIILGDYVSDTETSDADITWTTDPATPTNYTVTIDASNIATITPNSGSSTPSEIITFIATDDGKVLEKLKKSDSDQVTFTVSGGNAAPVVSDIENQSIAEGGTFTTINLDEYVTDPDNTYEEISWTYSGDSELTVSISDSRVATITVPSSDWNGNETITFTATDPGSLSDSDDATFTVTAVNDPPVVSNIGDQTVSEGGTFATINLDDFVADPDNDDDEIDWSYGGNTALTVKFSDSRVATITTLSTGTELKPLPLPPPIRVR